MHFCRENLHPSNDNDVSIGCCVYTAVPSRFILVFCLLLMEIIDDGSLIFWIING
jgi:hypothetical protein